MRSIRINNKKVLSSIIYVIFMAIALCANYSKVSTLQDHSNLFRTSGMELNGLLIVALFFMVYILSDSIEFKKSFLIIGAIFGILNVAGMSMHYYDSFKFVTLNKYQFALSIFCVFGWTLIFTFITGVCFKLFSSNLMNCTKEPKWKITELYCKHTFLCSFIIILFFWSFWIIAFYPGSANYDYIKQIATYDGYFEMNNHHPVLSTLIIGTCMKIGRTVCNDNLGVFLYTLLQSVVMAYAFARITEYISKIGCNMIMQVIALLFYAVIPIWGGNCQFGDKDILYCGILLLFALDSVKIIREPDSELKNVYKAINYAIIAFLVCMLRKNGIYAVAAMLILMAVFVKNRKKALVICCITVIGLYEIIQKVIFPICSIEDDSIAEALSVPFQQTARYVRDNGDDVTEDEKDAINNILVYDELSEKYYPQCSDPVKADCKQSEINGDNINIWQSYFSKWAVMFFKHPGTYIQATVANTYGYYAFTPDIHSTYLACSEKFYSNVSSGPKATRGTYNIKFIDKLDGMREFLRALSTSVSDMPVLGLTYSCAFYTWLLVILIMYEKNRKRYMHILMTIPAIITILVAMASPVNDCFRYYIFAAAIMPLYFAIVCSKEVTHEE